ncbi:MAG: PIG-L family deacetylase [Saprospiraceae bacterium]
MNQKIYQPPRKSTTLVGQRVLVLAPHPDDEALGCGGSLVQHRVAGDAVKIIFITDGAAADRQGQSKSNYIQMRMEEARAAAQILDVDDLEFWQYADGRLDKAKEFYSQLNKTIQSYQPTLIYSPPYLDFHPDHRATVKALWKFIQTHFYRCIIAFYEINTPILINSLVDISTNLNQKKRACEAHVSQHLNIPYTDIALGLNRFRSLTISENATHAEGYLVIDSKTIFGKKVETLFPISLINTQQNERSEVPLVSIIVRTKDRPELLQEALTSLVRQTHSRIEVLVVNDGGVALDAVLDTFRSDLELRYFPLTSSQGRSAAANVGLQMASGKYVGFLDDDDLLYPHHIEKLVTALECCSEKLVYSDCEKGDYFKVANKFYLRRAKLLYKGVDFDRKQLAFNNYIPIMTALFHRSLYHNRITMRTDLDALEDWDLWLQFSKWTDFKRVAGITAEYRFFKPIDYDFLKSREQVITNHPEVYTLSELTALLQTAQRENDLLHHENHQFKTELLQLRSGWQLKWWRRKNRIVNLIKSNFRHLFKARN